MKQGLGLDWADSPPLGEPDWRLQGNGLADVEVVQAFLRARGYDVTLTNAANLWEA